MAKSTNKKSAKEASNTFYKIMQASVKVNSKSETKKLQSTFKLSFECDGEINNAEVSVLKNPKSNQAKLSVLIDTPSRMFIDFTYAFLGAKHRLIEVNHSTNYKKKLTPSIEKALREHPKFPFIEI